MRKGPIIGIIAAVIIVAVAVPLASPLFTSGPSADEPLPKGALLPSEDGVEPSGTMMDDDKMDDKDGMMMDDDKMDDKDGMMMDDDKMDDKDGMMMDDDKMMDDKDGMMMDDDAMMDDEMTEDAKNAIAVYQKDLDERGDEMTAEERQMLEDMIEEIEEKGVSAQDMMMEEEMPEMMSDDMQEEMQAKVYRGTFIGADMYTHNVQGTVTIVPTEDGTSFVRLNEDFKTNNGPRLVVYLVPDYTKGGSVSDNVDLGDLRGTSGAQNYAIPADTDLEKYNTVLIWCEPFSALFGYAALS